MDNICLFGFQISNSGLVKDVERAWRLIKSETTGNYLACLNPHSMVVASRDKLFRDALNHANILVPDGIGIVLAAQLLKLHLKEKVAGMEFFLALTEYAEKNGGLNYFFLGSNETTLNRIKHRLNKEFPSINVCGLYAPPYKENFSKEENQKMIEAVNVVKPDVLWVGMTAPKQEKWIFLNQHELKVPFIAAIGAAFDFYAGTKKRASIFWRRLGLEWLPRFLREPRRLWKRNLQSNPIFISWVLKAKINQMIQFNKKS